MGRCAALTRLMGMECNATKRLYLLPSALKHLVGLNVPAGSMVAESWQALGYWERSSVCFRVSVFRFLLGVTCFVSLNYGLTWTSNSQSRRREG